MINSGAIPFVTSDWCLLQVNRPLTMRKDGIQTRKRKPKNVAGDAKNILKSHGKYLPWYSFVTTRYQHRQAASGCSNSVFIPNLFSTGAKLSE